VKVHQEATGYSTTGLAREDQQVGRHVVVAGGPRRRGRRAPRAQIIMTSMYPIATLIAIL